MTRSRGKVTGHGAERGDLYDSTVTLRLPGKARRITGGVTS
ncbi:hypothetical protein ACFV0L_31800 [Streptosporangium canum]